MGMELIVELNAGAPSWESMQTRWKHTGIPITIRMIDGLPAFPDEVPGEEWKEVRLGTPAGMLTLRRMNDRIACVVWGNADAELLRHWQISAWVCAAAGCGRIVTANGSESPESFLQSARLFEA